MWVVRARMSVNGAAALGHHLTSCEPAVLVHALHNTAKITYVNISGFNRKKKVKIFLAYVAIVASRVFM